MSKPRIAFLVIMATALVGLIVTACSSTPSEVNASLGEEVNLSPDRTVAIDGEQLKIKFLEVVQDSRCPKDVICIWQGEVSVLVEITYFESLHRVVLTQSGLSGQFATKDFNEYTLAFRVEPYPDSATQIPAKDYRLVLVVTRR